MSSRSKFSFFLLIAMTMILLGGCKKHIPAPPIDLEQVNEAFLATSGSSFGAWMHNFEKAVNEIYLKDDVVFISARRPYIGKLRIYGYIDRNGVVSYQKGVDELLFEIRQYKGTYRFSYELRDGSGWIYKRHYYNRPGRTSFLTYALISAALWHPYYTPRSRVVVIRRYRRTYRRSPRFVRRRKRYSRFSKRTRSRRRSFRRSRRGRRSKFGRRRRGSRRSYRSRRSGGKY